jgi:N-acyl-D-aspartate/D-glutamate deacylase
VHRLTQEPAEFFGLDVGVLKVGAQADLVVIDPEALRRFEPEASISYVWREAFSHHQLVNRPDGVVRQVMLAGKLAWQNGAYLPAFGRERMGRVLRHKDHKEESRSILAAAA